jgi:hypothetical protein
MQHKTYEIKLLWQKQIVIRQYFHSKTCIAGVHYACVWDIYTGPRVDIVLGFFSRLLNWDPPPAHAGRRVCIPPLVPGEGGVRYTRLRERGWGGPNSDEGKDNAVLWVPYLCTLWYRYWIVCSPLMTNEFQYAGTMKACNGPRVFPANQK